MVPDSWTLVVIVEGNNLGIQGQITHREVPPPIRVLSSLYRDSLSHPIFR
jgi:hypothetical protein